MLVEQIGGRLAVLRIASIGLTRAMHFSANLASNCASFFRNAKDSRFLLAPVLNQVLLRNRDELILKEDTHMFMLGPLVAVLRTES